MRTYRIKLLSRILISAGFMIFIILPIFVMVILHEETSLVPKLFIVPLVFIGLLGLYAFNTHKIIIDDERIEVVRQRLLPRTGTLYWHEISKLTSEYFLYPEAGCINIIPKPNSGKNFLRISIWGMPIELVRDILSHLHPDTKVYLYPYLKRKAEDKQTWFYIK